MKLWNLVDSGFVIEFIVTVLFIIKDIVHNG